MVKCKVELPCQITVSGVIIARHLRPISEQKIHVDLRPLKRQRHNQEERNFSQASEFEVGHVDTGMYEAVLSRFCDRPVLRFPHAQIVVVNVFKIVVTETGYSCNGCNFLQCGSEYQKSTVFKCLF